MKIDQRRLRILQLVGATIILFAIGMFLADGRPLGYSLVAGVTFGGMSFVLTALVLFAYWGLRGTVGRSGQ